MSLRIPRSLYTSVARWAQNWGPLSDRRVDGQKPAPSKSKRGKQRSKFEGECSKCGKWGHRSEECRGGKQKKKYDRCLICGSQEHKAANCPKRWKGENGNESALLTRATAATGDPRNTNLGKSETWTSDSRATSTMTPSPEGLLNYTVEPEGRCVVATDGKLLPVAGSGQLEIVAEQP